MPKDPKLEDQRANFRDADGKPYVVRCPNCLKENWALSVSTGECAWCQWKAEEI